MTQAASSYLRKGDDLENFRYLSEGIYETQKQKQIELEIQEKHSLAKIVCLSIGAVAFFALGMVALIYKKAPKIGVGSILLSLPLFLFTTQNIQSKNLLKKQSSQTAQEIFDSLIAKMYVYTAAKQRTVREVFKNKLFSSKDQLVREIHEFAERYDDLSEDISTGTHTKKLRIESIQILPFIKKIASQESLAISPSLYSKWEALQKVCRIFLNTEKDVPFVEIEQRLDFWQVKPETVDLYT